MHLCGWIPMCRAPNAPDVLWARVFLYQTQSWLSRLDAVELIEASPGAGLSRAARSREVLRAVLVRWAVPWPGPDH